MYSGKLAYYCLMFSLSSKIVIFVSLDLCLDFWKMENQYDK